CAPPPGQAAWARDLLAAADAAGSGAFEHDGRMVDGPILRHARLLAKRSRPAPSPPSSPDD
ncbi:MAG: CoA ester lyase, partial [Brachybacterium sp.]|nr:CoA ester lyase [Brachybacterium sp.]